jgi:ribonucleoside-diphosphate reductase beta chain
MSVFDYNSRSDHLKNTAFFGDSVTIARYDTQKYPFLEKLTEKQLSFFWLPQEVDVTRDKDDFRRLSSYEQHIFTSNLKRQILLDSVQGRSPSIAFLPIVSLPELETWIQTWAANETIHSRSYTHIIRNIYPNPSKVFDEILDIQEIVDCAKDISKYYDELIAYNNLQSVSLRQPGSEYQHKKSLWLALMSVNVLEGIRFYVSFACSWAFAELKKMEGNAKIIKFICRDENVHLAGTQQLLKILPSDDSDFEKIKEETKDQCVKLFVDAVDQEKKWANYLFKDGSMIGLNETLLCEYVEWITHKRMTALGLPCPYKAKSNPLPWTQKWISGNDVQVAPQEVELSSYLIGGLKQDVDSTTFRGFSL